MEQYDVIILDVRTPEEFNSGHIPDAVLMPGALIPLEIHYAAPDLDQIILVYCRAGTRSARAARALVEMGYSAVYDFGGILGWPGEIVSEYE
jgi:rhodanese-related sulfurtransferase